MRDFMGFPNLKLSFRAEAVRALVIFCCVMASALLHAQPMRQPQPPPPQPGGFGDAGSGAGQRGRDGVGFQRGMRMPGPGGADGATSGAVSFRQHMSAELENVPLLSKRLKEILENQQQITAVRRQRQRVSAESGRSSSEIMKTFHNLLEREDRLTSRQEELFGGLTKDEKAIREQVQMRMATLMSDVEKKRESVRRGEPHGSFGELQNMERTLKFYEYILESLPNLSSSDRRSQTLRRLLTGRWDQFGDIDPRILDSARRRLQQLEGDLENVRRNTQRIEEQISELRELIQRTGGRADDGEGGIRENRRESGGRGEGLRGEDGPPNGSDDPLNFLIQPNP